MAGLPLTIAKSTAGVLPIFPAMTQANASAPKTPAAQSRLKVVIRRLPPGLTQAEFEIALGDEWKAGNGRVDWSIFRAGKASKDLAKPSRPGRAYLHVTNASHLDLLAEKVRQTPFTDARATSSDAVLLGPPMLEFAPHGRIPVGKKRPDPRQGLVDQDPEFIAFLESLTNPIAKTAPSDSAAEGTGQKGAKVTVTPLILHLREKKAAKEAAKEKSTAAKAAKNTRQPGKTEPADSKTKVDEPSLASKEVSKSPEKKSVKPTAKVERPAKIAARPAKPNESAVSTQAKTPATGPATNANSQKTTVPANPVSNAVPQPAAAPRRPEPPNPGAAAARMLQRDLGLRGRGGTLRRGGRQPNETSKPPVTPAIGAPPGPSSPAQTPTQPGNATDAASPPSSAVPAQNATLAQPTASPKPPTAPALMRRGMAVTNSTAAAKPATVVPSTTQATMNQAATNGPKPLNTQPTAPTPSTTNTPTPVRPSPVAPPRRPNPIPSPTSTCAFLKHANPSQGITEDLLNTSMQSFGAVTHVEIDKRKGFAYVEFETPEGLQKAMAASPIKIAQGSVQVLERKDRLTGGAPRVQPVVNAVPGRGGGNVAGPGFARGGGNLGRGGPMGAGPANAYRGGRGGSVRGRGGMLQSGNIATNAVPLATQTSTSSTPAASDATASASLPSGETPVTAPAESSAATPEATSNAALPEPTSNVVPREETSNTTPDVTESKTDS